QLVDDQTAWNRAVDIEPDLRCNHPRGDPTRLATVRGHQVIDEGTQVRTQLDAREVLGLVEQLMDQRHRLDAALALDESLARQLAADRRDLQVEQARDHLEVVLHAVVNLAEQYLLL